MCWEVMTAVNISRACDTHKLVNTGKRGPPIVPLLFIHFRNTSHMFCTRLANSSLFPTGDPIVPFVISPWFECLNKLTHVWFPDNFYYTVKYSHAFLTILTRFFNTYYCIRVN